MKSAIDKTGRLVIPKAVRVAAGLEHGMEVEIRFVDGRIEIEPAPLDVQLEKRGRLVVAVPTGTAETLTADDVETTIAELRGGTTDD